MDLNNKNRLWSIGANFAMWVLGACFDCSSSLRRYFSFISFENLIFRLPVSVNSQIVGNFLVESEYVTIASRNNMSPDIHYPAYFLLKHTLSLFVMVT